MFKNYIKSALRFIKQNKVFAAINLLGLSTALAVSFIMMLYIINEYSYDNCHKNRKRVYKVLNYYVDFKRSAAETPYVLSKALKDQFPQIEKATTIGRIPGFMLKFNEDSIIVRESYGATSDIFDIFTIPLINGASERNILDDPNSIIISRSLSEIIFHKENPVGQEITAVINKKKEVLLVKGVFEDMPINTTFSARCLLNGKWTTESINKDFNITDAETNWTMNFWRTWILLSKGTNPHDIESQLRAFEIKNIGQNPQYNYSLQNLSDVYLGSENIMNAGTTGSRSNIRLFFSIAILIVLVATVNYIILSTAVSSDRSMEIGIRKTFGAINNNLKGQLLSESVLLSVFVLPVALLLMRLALPSGSELFETKLTILKSNLPIYAVVYLTLTLLIGIVSGLYTSSYLSRLKVIDVIKSTNLQGRRKQFFRSILIIIQLVIFCSFVSASMIIRSQYNFAIKKDPGYFNKDIILIDLGRDFRAYSAYINSIRSSPDIIMAGGVMEGLPMQSSMSMMIPHFQDKSLKVNVEGLAVDFGFLQTMGIRLVDGRLFSQEFGSDMSQAIVLNEKAVKQLGIIDPVGKQFFNQSIIGVVKDFNLHSIHTDIPPLSISMTDRYIQQVAVHYKPGSLKRILPMLENEWKKTAPGRPFSFTTIEDLIKSIYASEKNLSRIVSISALFTLLIAAFGLFGLTMFVTRSRVREIGIKKVFGSTATAIVCSFMIGNLFLVGIATLISIPVTFYFMNKWLNNFAYHTDINWWIFLTSFIIASGVVLLTVFFHSYKASQINPVDALRHE